MTTTGAARRVTSSVAALHARVAPTIGGDQPAPSVRGSTPALLGLVEMTTIADLDCPVRLATAGPVARQDHVVIAAMPLRIDDRSDVMTTSADSAPANRPTGHHARAMTEMASEDVVRRDRSVVTMTDDRHEQVRPRASSVVIGRPARRAVVHGRTAQVAHVAGLVGRDAGRTPVRAVRRVVRGRDPVGRDLVGRDNARVATTRQVEQEVAVSNRRMTITIDGPAAAGKSTVGEIVARKIDGVYFDTGILYRALTLLSIEQGVAQSDETRLADLAAAMDIQIGRPTVDDGRQVDVLLDGRDVTNSLRTPAIDQNVSAVSAHALVRSALLEQQRRIGRSGRVVMVGRDIGTVVLPDAELKIFLDASPEERARRRCLQLDEMGRPLPYNEVLADMKRRDRIDSERDVAPLKPAEDAIVIDSDSLTIEEVADEIVSHAEQRLEAVRG